MGEANFYYFTCLKSVTMDFGSSSLGGAGGGAPGGQLTGAQKEMLMEQVKQQVAIQTFNELLQKMTNKCFSKCVSKPGTSLDSGEQRCLSYCMDRYMETWNLVSKTYQSRILKERGS